MKPKKGEICDDCRWYYDNECHGQREIEGHICLGWKEVPMYNTLDEMGRLDKTSQSNTFAV